LEKKTGFFSPYFPCQFAMAPAKRSVAFCMEGSRGDMQPYIVAAVALKEAGYDVLVLGPTDSEDMAKQHGLTFRHCGISAREVTESPEIVKAITESDYDKLTAAVSAAKKPHRRHIWETVVNELKSFKPGLIISSGMNLGDCIAVGKGLDIPVMPLYLALMVPSNYIPVLGLLPQLPSFGNMNWTAWKLILGMLIKRSQKESLPELADILGQPQEDLAVSFNEMCQYCSSQARFPALFAVSLALHGPFPQDFNEMCRAVGPLTFKPQQQVGVDFGSSEVQRLEKFLEECKLADEAPVYMGFGSMTCHNSKFMTLLCLRALMSCGRRGILLQGWAKLSMEAIEGEADSVELEKFCRDKVIFVDGAAHGQLFPRCSVIVHHGGAGTTYASAMSGVPCVIVPIFMDQYIHSNLVNKKGVGVGLKSMKSCTVEELSSAIRQCLDSKEIRLNAAALGQELSKD